MELKISLEQLGREPRIWHRIPGYVVRNYSPDLEESVLYHMTTHFLHEEIFVSTSKVAEDPVSLHEVTEWWREFLKQNLTVIALPEDAPGADLSPVTEKIVTLSGVNILTLARKSDPPLIVEEKFKGAAIRRSVGTFYKITKMVNCFEKYGVDMCMDAAGFSVHPSQRRRGLGDALLQARFQLCAALGVRVTKTVFSSIPAQVVALRNDMLSVVEIPYGDLKDETGGAQFPGIPPKDKVLVTVRADLC